MTARQRITSGLGMAVLAGSLAAFLAFVPAAGAGEVPAPSRAAAPTLVLDNQPPRAADSSPAQGADNRAPVDLAREGMAKMLQALDKLVESIPQYQLPEITENGDIVLRRKKPDVSAPPVQQQPNSPDNRAI